MRIILTIIYFIIEVIKHTSFYVNVQNQTNKVKTKVSCKGLKVKTSKPRSPIKIPIHLDVHLTAI